MAMRKLSTRRQDEFSSSTTKRSLEATAYDFSGIFRAAAKIDGEQQAFDFPAIEWCSDSEDEMPPPPPTLLEKVGHQSPNKRRKMKRSREEMSSLVRSKALPTNLMILGSPSADRLLERQLEMTNQCTQQNLSKVPFLPEQRRDLEPLTRRRTNRTVTPPVYSDVSTKCTGDDAEPVYCGTCTKCLLEKAQSCCKFLKQQAKQL